MATTARSIAAPKALPKHDYAADHVLLKAFQDPVNRRRRLRDASKTLDTGSIAKQRIREFAYDLGMAEKGLEHGWIAHVGRLLSLEYATIYGIVAGDAERVSTQTVDKVATALNLDPRFFYDDNL